MRKQRENELKKLKKKASETNNNGKNSLIKYYNNIYIGV